MIVSQSKVLLQPPNCQFNAEPGTVDLDNLRGGQRDICGQQEDGLLDSFHHDHFEVAQLKDAGDGSNFDLFAVQVDVRIWTGR